ncbi:hypothetical protein [Paraburkholderia sp. BCC1885]|uniref:hypothetical protein n=1 Tax=Paraburkholderia sp. BCC1885 TaxID=2562669 RepID=UPI0011820748|nr:hypothetical protein [Paraburkholderia sp. BCC1885]
MSMIARYHVSIGSSDAQYGFSASIARKRRIKPCQVATSLGKRSPRIKRFVRKGEFRFLAFPEMMNRRRQSEAGVLQDCATQRLRLMTLRAKHSITSI